MVAGVDSAATAHLGADGPVLLKGGSADDGGRVGAHFLPNLVDAAVGLDGAVLRGAGVVRRVVLPHRLDHVILDQRIGRPPVHAQVRVTVDFKGA